jgi:hypothetical protein
MDGPIIPDLYNRIVSDRSGLEKILARLPGFRGYTEMSARRAADREVREFIVRLLQEQQQRLIGIERDLVSKGGIRAAGQSREAKTKFQIFVDRVNTASPGYSGFYDAVKVGSNDLANIYAFDAALIGYVDQFRDALDVLEKAVQNEEGIAEAVVGLERVADEANLAFNLREDVITGIRGG